MASISESPVPAVRPINLNYAASDREVSIRILEYTAVTITTLMFLWLLIWFQFQPPRFTEIRSFYMEPDSSMLSLVLFQESDAAEIAKYGRDKDNVKESGKAERLDAGVGSETLKARLGSVVAEDKKPCIIYLSAPAFGHGPGTTIGKHEPGPKPPSSKNQLVELIGELAKEANRPVLLAIDAAQVSSSREFGIYANDPYQGLSEALNEIKTPNNVPFLVLTSCGPAQTSELRAKSGGSLFALVLEQALKQQRSNSSKRITFEDLGKRVAVTVDKLTDKRQTPQLITIGKKVTLTPQISLEKPGTNENSKLAQQTFKNTGLRKFRQSTTVQNFEQDKERAKSELQKGKLDESAKDSQSSEKLVSKEDWLKSRRIALDEIWEKLRLARKSDPAPFRYGFVTWRNAEDELIKAERFLLEFKLSPNPTEDAQKRLDSQIYLAEIAVNAISPEQKGNLLFQPIRPDGGQDEDAAKKATELVAWLAEVTGSQESKIRNELRLEPSSAAQGDAQPGNSAVADTKYRDSLIQAVKNYGNTVERPEQMLAIWGKEFRNGLEKKFDVPKPSWDLKRLVEATEIRFDAEAALALAEQWGGESAIQPLVTQGDKARRKLEDLAFAPTDGSPDGWDDLRAEANTAYKEALELARARRKAITAADQALLDLPNYASSIIEARSKVENNSSNGAGEYPFFPGTLSEPLDNIKNLVDGLAEPEKSTPEELSKVVERLHESLKGAKKVTVDPLLRLNVPGIDHDERTGLYNELKYSSLPDVYDSRGELKEPKPAHDLSHLGRAIGLARLELELTKASLTEEVLKSEVGEKIKELEKLVESLEEKWKTKKESIDPGKFAEVEEAVVKLREQLTDGESGTKIAVNPILAWPHFAVRNWNDENKKALAQALKPDREKLGKFQADRLIEDRGDGPLPVKISRSPTLIGSKPVDVQVQYGSDSKASDIAAPGAGTSTILVLGIPKNSAQSNPPMQPSPQPTPEGDSILAKPVKRDQPSPIPLDKLAWDLIPADQPKSVGFNVIVVGKPEKPALLAAAFHRGMWADSAKTDLTRPKGFEYDVTFTLSKKLLKENYRDKVGNSDLDSIVEKILTKFDERKDPNKGYARLNRPFFGAFVVKRNWDDDDKVYMQIEVTPPGGKPTFEFNTPVQHSFSKKGDEKIIDFDLKPAELSMEDDTMVKLIVSRNKDFSNPIELEVPAIPVRAVPALNQLDFRAESVTRLRDRIQTPEPQDIELMDHPASILTVTRKKEDKVVEPLVEGDIIVEAFEVNSMGKNVSKGEWDLIKVHAKKRNSVLLWPGESVDRYFVAFGDSISISQFEWRLKTCVGDELPNPKEKDFFKSATTEKK